MTVRAAVEDPEGRPVELTEERWQHIVERHPEVEAFCGEVMHAIQKPDRRVQGRVANEAWHYLKTDAPSAWLRVVVAYAEGRGHIVTAHARRSMP
jgi:hypothetical protein